MSGALSADEFVVVISVVGLQLLGLWFYDTVRAVKARWT